MAEDQKLAEAFEKFAGVIGQVVPRKKVTSHEYQLARAKREKLKRRVFMSGAEIRENQVNDEEIALLNKLRAGKYNEGRWAVLERHGGSEGGSIDILIPNATQEDRIRLMGEAPNLATLLKRIVAEHEAAESKRK